MARRPPKPVRFDANWQRRRKAKSWLRKLGWWLVIAGVVLVAWWLGLIPNMATRDGRVIDRDFVLCGQRGGGAACVPDGDTVIIGGGETRRRIRLTGFDAPEIDGACDAEREKARIAQRELLGWLNDGPFQWDGGEEPPYDRYGRELRAAWRDVGEGKTNWLADHMIARGLASESGWGTTPVDWCK